MIHVLSVLLLIFFFSAQVLAGEPTKAVAKTVMISGKVLDPKTNELLAGVKIACDACQKTVYSDLDGRFFLYLQIDPAKPAGIEFSQVGYLAKTLSLQELGASAGNLEISLEQE